MCDEHLIPEALGGCLTCKFLCISCNSWLGRALEVSARSDPSILLAAQNLAEDITVLATQLIESHPHIGYSENGPASGYFRNGEFRVKAQKLNDGSLVQATDGARESVVKILKKSGYEGVPLQQALLAFDYASEDKRVEISPGLEIVKWPIQKIELDLTKTKLMDPLIPAKIAFEFIACHVGTTIYEDVPHLSEIRKAFLDPTWENQAVRIDRLSSNKYEPFHGICFEGNDPYAKVLVMLFGWLVFRIHFLHLSIGGPRFVYTHRLDTGAESIDSINVKN